MSEFKTRLLGFSAIAMAFAGMSYGQTLTNCTNLPSANPTVRSEGETELTGNPGLVCDVSTQVTGAVYVNTSVAITSTVESKATSGAALPNGSDAILGISTDNGAHWSSVYPSSISGTQASFTNVTIPAGHVTLAVFNLRVNANAASNPQITATVLVSYANGNQTANVTSTAENIAYALSSLNAKIDTDSSNKNIWYLKSSNSASFKTCSGSSITTGNPAVAQPAFTLDIQELFAGAFRTQAQEGGTYLGSASNLPANPGVATQATLIKVAFANVPTQATIYLPLSVTSGDTVLKIQGASKDTSASATLSLPNTDVGSFTAAADGTLTVTYETIQTGANTGTLFNVPVFVKADKNTVPVQSTAMTVAVSYAPAAAVTGPQATIPTFAVSTASPIKTLTVTACNTTLLFPYVTNKVGFETGIAIANTTSDNLKSDGTSSLTATTGTCTLNFYGDAATQPKAFTTDKPIGAFDASTGAAPVYANLLTTMSGASNFSGYVIARCNFQDAHGYAFLVAPDGAGTPGAVAQGYLALVTNDPRDAEGFPGLGN